ncbi:cell division protein FtsQ/DivIB [Pseudobutyrivibrio sp. MD2005]|uniref:cell division protein FtsQ/DivIB n=1 Tax=Pseudobutyrivibrio sp. MD2005 TaxID=1410616 RepID=UPI0004808F43|nr:cell division protein FtsQ/DivIB [Pseudobutyrivibrio sp. MD2005]
MSRRRKKRRGIGSFILVLIEIILAIVILGMIFAAAAFYFCTLKDVTVEGTDLYTKEEVTGYILDDKYSSNAMYAFFKNKIFPKSDAEFIESFDVELTGMNSLKIICNEKTILGYMVTEEGKYIYFDYDGIIVEISDAFVDRGYMRVDGVECQEPKIGEELSIGEDQIGYLTALIKILQKNELMPNVISYDERGRITLGYDTYNISLGSSVYLEEKIDRLLRILPQIDGMYGTLHLENYSSQNTDIVFEKEDSEEE